MSWLLSMAVIFWILFGITYRMADRPGDDFGAVVLPLLFGAIALVLTVIYVSLVLYHHRFL